MSNSNSMANSSITPSIVSSDNAQKRLNDTLKKGVDKACETANNLRGYISPKVLIGIIVFILIGIFLFYWFFIRKDSKEIGLKQANLIPYIHDLKVQKTVNQKDIPNSSQGNEYNINFWIFINDYDYKYNDEKVILYIGDRNNTIESNPYIYMKPRENTLVVKVGLQTDNSSDNPTNTVLTNNTVDSEIDNLITNANSNSNISNNQVVANNSNISNNQVNSNINTVNSFNTGAPNMSYSNNQTYNTNVIEAFNSNNSLNSNTTPYPDTQNSFNEVGLKEDVAEVPNIPLQRWCNINISLYNNILDISLDGKLELTKILKGFPTTSKGNLRLGADGGLNGYLSNLVFTNRVIDMEKVESIYESGPTLQAGFFN